MKPVPLQLVAYSDDARSFANQECVGWIAVNAEMPGTRSGQIGRQLPGLREFCTLPGVTRQRGARVVEGRLFVVGDDRLYQVQPSGGTSSLLDIPGAGRVSMSHNQVAGGNELLIANGSSGYVWNTATASGEAIADDGFNGAIVVDFIGQLFVTVEPQRRTFQNSAIAGGLIWDGTETYQGETSPDRIVSLKVNNGELVLLSERTIEHFDHTGVVNALFQNKKIPIDRGCAATHAVDNLDGGLFFIGEDGSGYVKRGYQLQRITTHAIEQAWARCDLSKAFSFVWEDRGHKVWYVTFPDGFTWGYDCATQKWHRRQSKDMDRWRLAWLVKWNGDWYGGEYHSGRIFRLDWDYAMEGADELPRFARLGKLHNNGAPVRVAAFRPRFDCFGPESVYEAGVSLALSGDLPDGNVGEAVTYSYTGTGTATPLVFSIIGALPDGLSMDADGHVTGTFTASGEFSWTVKVTDADGTTATLADSCVVTVLSLEITGSLPDTLDSVAYSERLGIVGGVAPYANATISAGALPTTGTVTIDGDELVIAWSSGQTADVYDFTVRVEDSEGSAATSPQEVEIFQTYTGYVGHAHTAAAAVSLFDPDTNTITGTLAAGSGLQFPQITDDGLTLVGMGQSYPTKVLISTGVATTLTSAFGQAAIAIDDTYVYSLKFSTPALYKQRISDGVLIATYNPSVACGGNKLAWNADRSKLYMPRYDGYGFTVLNVAAGTLTNYATTGHANGSGRGIDVRASDEHVFKVGQYPSDISPRLTHYSSTGTVLGYVAIPEYGQNPTVNPAGTELWVPSFIAGINSVYVFDITGSTPVLLETIAVGGSPNWVTFSPDGLKAYVTNGVGDSISVINALTYAVTTTVSTNDAPHGVCIVTG